MSFDARMKAPAKVNLTLRVLGRRHDGYHELESLVAFAGVADTLTFAPGAEWSIEVNGPTALDAGADADNLVLKAASELASRIPGLPVGRFRLTKRLPVAAGLGGGSSDAAAALRLLAGAAGLPLGQDALHTALVESARATGADVPVCLEPRARMMAGIGERIGPALELPPLFAVLVNPRVAVPTPMVFRALALEPGQALESSRGTGGGNGTDTGLARTAPASFASLNRDRTGLLGWLAAERNDLQAPASKIAPVIAETLAALAASAGCRLARMSGSGATCFGLYDDCHAAARAARSLRDAHPGWWIAPTLLR